MEKPVLINMATKMPTEKLRETFPELKWTYMKFVGHAAGLKRDGNGLFVTHTGTEEAIRHRFAQIGRVETAAEETAEKVNRLATTHAVQAARNMEKQMEEEGWESIYTEEALHSLMPEVIRAYSEGKLGQFGKKIVEEMDSGKTE